MVHYVRTNTVQLLWHYIGSGVLVCTLVPGADPGILERGARVREQSPEPSAGGGSGGLPQKILKN